MTGAFLVGCLAGALGVLVLTGLSLWFTEWRAAWRDGAELDGDGMERNRKREES